MFKTFPPGLCTKEIKRLRWLNCVRHSVFWQDHHKHDTACMHGFPWKHRCDDSSS